MKNTILLLLSLITFTAFGQECGTPIPNLSKIKNYIEKSSLEKRGQNPTYCIDVQFHVIRETNGTNAFNPQNTNLIIDNLNADFNIHKIYFNNIGTNFINNSDFVNIDSSNEAENLANQNNNPNALNYYIVETLWNVNGGFITGTAIDIPSINLVIRNDRTLTSTSPHEVGHCLDLYHTHETGLGVEQINGSNCSTAGDLVCDTPADPRLGNNNVNNNCVYTGGGGFNPLTNNIMSYSPNFCRDVFTIGQKARIHNALANNSILSSIVSNSCSIPKLSGHETVCNSNKTFTLQNGGNSVSWQVSSNLQIVSSNNSSITVKAKFSTSSGEGFVRAILLYETLQNDIWVGKAEPNYIIFRNGVGGTYYWCSSNTDNEFEILPRVPNTTYQVRVKNFPALNVVAGPYNFTGNIATLPTDYNYTPSWYIFEVKATNECGTTDWFGSEVEFVDCSTGGGGEYRVYPNPASETLTIQKNNFQQTAQNENLNSANRGTTGSFELYDFSSNLILNGKLSNHLTIDVSKYKKGRYILKIYSDGKTESHQVIVE